MPSFSPPTEDAPDVRVSTEPQRRALDAMSQELVRKLNVMVAEQEARAREFAARQHSLSSLPQTPPFATDEISSPLTPPPDTRQRTTPPPLVTRPQATPSPRPNLAPPPPTPPGAGFPPFPFPRPKREPSKESNVGAFPIIVAILIGLIILRSCGS